MLIIIIILILAFWIKFGGALEHIVPIEADKIQTNLMYPQFCFRSEPNFSSIVLDYPKEVKGYFAEATFKNVVLNPYRKNLLYSPYRMNVHALFSFVQKYKITELVAMCQYYESVEYLVKKTGVKVHLFNTTYNKKNKNPNIILINGYLDKKNINKYKGMPLYCDSNFRHVKFNFDTLYLSVRYNIDYHIWLHGTMEPKYAYHMMQTFNKNVNVEMPFGILKLATFCYMTISPYFIIDCSFYKKEKLELNMQDIFCRIHVFNVCSRNLNYSNSGDYLTYDTYNWNKTMPNDKDKFFGPLPILSGKILKETSPEHIDIKKPYFSAILLSPDTVKGSIIYEFIENLDLKFGPYELDSFIAIDKKTVKFEINTFINMCFDRIPIAVYIDIHSISSFPYVRYSVNEIYINRDKKMPIPVGSTYAKIKYVKNFKQASKLSKNKVYEYPYANKKAIETGKNLILGQLQNVSLQTIWIESNPIIDFLIIVLHEAFPDALINCIGDCLKYKYVNNYENIENWRKLFVEPNDCIIDAIAFT